MKKLFFLTALLAPFFMASCSNDDAPADETTRTGTLKVGKATLDLEVDLMSRAVTLEDCWLVLQDPSSLDLVVKIEYPQEGIVTDIPEGDYIFYITTQPYLSYPIMEFEHPMYEYSTRITIEAGKQTVLEDVVVSQINAGVVFDYTGVEGTELENVVPIVTFNFGTNDYSLTYSGENRTKIGYFCQPFIAEWNLNITFTLDDEPLTVNGGEVSKQITANAKELWTIKLSVTSTEDDPYGELGAAGPELIVEPEGLGW